MWLVLGQTTSLINTSLKNHIYKLLNQQNISGPIDASLPEKKSRCQGATINMKRNPESANKEMEIMPQITTTKINSENPPSIKSVFI